MTQREAFEAHWHNMRGKKAAIRELQRHPLQPQTYVQDSANRHWVTWQAAQAQAAVDPVNEWTVIAPDGTRFTGPTPLKAAFPASKYRLEIDPVAAAPSSICPAPLPRYALAINYPTLSGSR